MFKWYYAVWLFIPLVFFLLALWSKLELMSGRPRKDHPSDVLNQGFFVLLSVFVCIAIDIYVLPGLYEQFVPTWIPIGLLQFLLLPAILLLAAQFLGPSRDIKIIKAPRPSKSKDSGKGKR